MPIGDSVTQPIPPVGTAGTSYASQLVAFLQEMKSRLENKVALSSLLAGLFDLNNNGITNVSYVGLYEQAVAPTTPVGSLQRYGGDLYYVSASGAVRITNGAALDVVSASGITGDYAAPAEFRYDLGALEYYAYSDYGASPKEWARVGAQGYDIYGTVDGTTRVRLAWAGGANPSYTMTLPATVPSITGFLTMDTSGNLTVTNRNNKTKLVSSGQCTWTEQGAAPYAYYSSGQVIHLPQNSTDIIVVPIDLDPGDTLTQVSVYINKASPTSVIVSATIYAIDKVTGTKVSINANSDASDGTTPHNATIAISANEVISDDNFYQVEIKQNSTSGNDSFRCAEIAYNGAL